MPGLEQTLISLEFNELNFDFVEQYVKLGQLPGFAQLLEAHRVVRTKSEDAYQNLEPWIQWPTVYTGKSFSDHNIFRLGDTVNSQIPQIWELLEQRNVKVGAVSPMNARNDCRAPAFFLPDPWTDTPVAAAPHTAKFFQAIRNIVNANSHERYRLPDIWNVVFHGIGVVRLASLREYLRILRVARTNKWARALILDRLLTDLFMNLWSRNRPGYTSLFLNAVAHVQHHHMYESAVYTGDKRNPDWYTSAKSKRDPLAFAYGVYDRILTDILSLPCDRLLITTALSQRPNSKPYFQYRLIDHNSFLQKIGIVFGRTLPRMSRDFSVFFATSESARRAAAQMRSVMIEEAPVFFVEERGPELFCQISYRGEPSAFTGAAMNGTRLDLSGDVTIVSIENAIHQSMGFHVDTGRQGTNPNLPDQIPLTEVFEKTLACFSSAA